MTDHTHSVGIDVGGTKILAGVWDDHELTHLSWRSTIPGDGPRNLATVRELLELEPYREINAVGISVTTSVGSDTVLRPDDGFMGWGGYSLERLLSNERRRVKAFSDVECGAVAEARWGAGRDARFVLYITIGTGLSHCYVIDGQPLVGSTSSSYYSGYIVPARCSYERCQADTLENISAGPAIARTYAEDAQAHDARPVFENARAGDPRALAIIEHAAWHLGAMIADLIHILNPEVIITGGGLGSAVHSYREQAAKVARSLVRPAECRNVPIIPAAFANNTSCCVGAAALVHDSRNSSVISK